ncbi:regulator of MON1-CCZ1 complex [Anthonomus grandis grandis]|uniref:regulator of MON1-CCZ1 complex n=1 Tax=Anthonomus grandis grandis TaxID=2921223 RepID=UPI0021652C56|nr:regulator of MON1-CCZ1 complex [Anthonomus grandis grandis]
MSSPPDDRSYLELSEEPVRFEPVNQLTNVFFDDSNKDVFTVRSGGVMGVVVKGPREDYKPLNFRMEDRGTVLSIKLSLDHKILAVQRTNSSVEFMNFNRESLDAEYSVSCKKNCNVLGFVWATINELALITDHGVELYTLNPEKKSVKQVKTLSVTVQWFVWCPTNKIAILASSHGSQLQPVLIKAGTINKLPKVETEPGRMALERDITLATLYDTPAVLILRHQSGPQTAEVHVHVLSGPGQSPVKSHVLKLGLSGRFAINVVDDLIVVHHQASKKSQIFDIALPGDCDGTVRYHVAVAPPKSFKSTVLTLPGLVEPQRHECELYSPNWVVFQPNIVIDAKLGCLWHIKLRLQELCEEIRDLEVCTRVLLKRHEGKPVLLKLLLDAINGPRPPLDALQPVFNHVNFVYREWVETELQSQSGAPPGAPLSPPLANRKRPRVLIDQNVMVDEIFQKITGDIERGVLLAYVSSLAEFGIPAQFGLNRMLVTNLAKQKKFTALQQLLQYGVIADSKPMAVLLLSLGNMHPSSKQMALDMLARLKANEEIQEVLLSDGQVLSALKLAKEEANVRKYLTAARNSRNPNLLHSVLFYFRNHPRFSNLLQNDERLHEFIRDYNAIFDG